MKKKKLPKDATRAEYFNWLLTSADDEIFDKSNSIDYKKRLINSIQSNYSAWQEFGRMYNYPFEDNIKKAQAILSKYTAEVASTRLNKLLSKNEAEQLLSFKSKFDESKEWAAVGMINFPPSSQNQNVKEVLINIYFWSKQQQSQSVLLKLRDFLLTDPSVTQLILNGFEGMNSQLTIQRFDIIDNLILEKRRKLKVVKDRNEKLKIQRELAQIERMRKIEAIDSNEAITLRNLNLEMQVGTYKKYFPLFKEFYLSNRALGKAQIIYEEFRRPYPDLQNYHYSKFIKNFHTQGYTLKRG